MKIMLRLSLCALLAVLLAPAAPAFAKGSPDEITIKGPGMSAPIAITDPDALSRFDPWVGQFLDADRAVVTNAPRSNAPYEVRFYARDAGGALRLFYVFYYLPGPAGMRGRIYLPQENEPWYDLDNYTIARRSGWLYASPEWDAFMQPLLSTRPSTGHSAASAAGSPSAALLGASGLVMAAAAVLLWFARRRRDATAWTDRR